MNIHGLTVCVDYADFLSVSIRRWRPGLESLTVVTNLQDYHTVGVAEANGCHVHRTDAFTQDGAAFNKGRAMEEARRGMPWEHWIVFFDADVVPPAGWGEIVAAAAPTMGNLYSARRFQCDDPARIDDPDLPPITGDGIGVGYFQLFHSGDPSVQREQVLETDWVHAGNYDNGFMGLWPRERRLLIPGLRLAHLGARDNWFGRGNKAAFDAMQAERRRRGGRWDHEKVSK